MDDSSINFERDQYPKYRTQASSAGSTSSQVRNLISSGAQSTLRMLEDTFEEVKSNPIILNYWLSLLLLRCKKESPHPEGKMLQYLVFIKYFAENEANNSNAIFKEYSNPLSVEIASCSVTQLIGWAEGLNDLREITYLLPSIRIMVVRLKQEAFNQMNDFMQAESIDSCGIIVNILQHCLNYDQEGSEYLNIIIQNVLEKFIENHDIHEHSILSGNDKNEKWLHIKEIFNKILEIEEHFNNKNKKLINKIKNSPILKRPPGSKNKKKKFKPEPLNEAQIELNSVVYEPKPVYMHTNKSFTIEVRRGTNNEKKSIILKHYHSFCEGFDFTHIMNEIDIVTFLSNHSDDRKAFVKLHYFHKRDDQICLWMDDGGENLMNFLTEKKNKNQKIPPNVIEEWITVLLENFAWLANNGIYHRDIKPHNILVNEKDMTLKIIDFSVGDYSSEKESTYSPTMVFPIQGTDGYLAPELVEAIENGQNTAKYKPGKSDVFSLGLTFLQLFTLEKLSGLNSKMHNSYLIEKVSGLNCSAWIKMMLKKMLELDWRSRYSFKKLLSFIPPENTRDY
jgi:uncharacterized membrane protein